MKYILLFITQCLINNQLKQKYNFLEDEDLKIEPKPVENIIEMYNIINNKP